MERKQKETDENKKQQLMYQGLVELVEAKGSRNWVGDEIALLIEMFTENPCLWEVFRKKEFVNNLLDS